MIRLDGPNMVINSHDVDPYLMTRQTFIVKKGFDVNNLLYWILASNELALNVDKTQLRNVVINAHGWHGFVSIGGIQDNRLEISNVAILSPLKGKNIGTIWITSCKPAN